MAKTLLAVDDSVTMRKVLEITFSGEDFRVITAENAQSVIGKLGDNPQVFIIDTVLGGEDGYALAKELRRRSPASPIIMLASRYSPYDQGRGRDAGADDWADKPFDTQQLIDKVRKVMLAKEAGGPQPGQASHMPQPPAQQPPQQQFRPAPPQHQPMAVSGVGKGTHPSLGGGLPPSPPAQQAAAQAGRTGTLVFGDPLSPAPPHAAQRPAPQVNAPPPQQARNEARNDASAPVAAAVNGHLAGKLSELGLTPQQAEAVLTLSRDVVERVVWEVVPQLAETLIKEEIARLTKQ